MTGFDYAVAVIMLLSSLLGLWRGLVQEMMALLGWPIALVMCKLFTGFIAPQMPLKDEMARVIVAYALVFIATLIIWNVLTRLFAKLMKKVGANWSDRMLGGLFGMMRGAILVLVVAWMIGLTNYYQKPFWHDALSRKTIEAAASLTRAWLPEDISKRIQYGIHS